MARILVLCSRIPYPTTGGAKIRMFHTAKLLADEHSVDLLIVDKAPLDESRIKPLKKIFENVTVFSFPIYRFYLNTLPGIISNRPLQTFFFSFKAVQRWVDERADRYDLFYCNHIRTVEYVREYTTPKVVDLVDAVSRNYENAGENSSGFWKVIYPIESHRLLQYERKIVSTFDRAFITTNEDKRYIDPSGQFPSLSVLQNGVREEVLARGPIDSTPINDRPIIAFLGKMNYFPNVDAASYFAETIFPKVRKEYPNAEFIIVGAEPSKKVRDLANQRGITVTGFVTEPIDYLEKAHVIVAPMRHGAGLQNKIIESMALGKAVVTTPLGLEGIKAEEGRQISVGHSSEDIAEKILALLSDINYREHMGKLAYNCVKVNYNWEKIGQKLHPQINNTLME